MLAWTLHLACCPARSQPCRFIGDHNLPASYQQQIVEFVIANTGGSRAAHNTTTNVDPFTGETAARHHYAVHSCSMLYLLACLHLDSMHFTAEFVVQSWVQMVCASHSHKAGAGAGAYVPGSGGPQPGSRRQPMGAGDPLSGSGAYIPGSHSTSASGMQCLGGSSTQTVGCCSRDQSCTACPTTVPAGL